MTVKFKVILRHIYVIFCLSLFIVEAHAAVNTLPASFAAVEGNDNEITSLGEASNTAQVVYGESLLIAADIQVGDQITGLAFRVQGGEVAPIWSVADYQIRLATSLNPPGSLDTNFIANRGGDYVVVRSGPLTYTGTEYPTGGSPNTFGPVIPFNTSFTYNGGDLLLEYTHSVIASGGSSADADGFITGAQSQWSAGFNTTTESFFGAVDNFAPIIQLETVKKSPATPVPTVPLFGLGILVSLLGLFGLRKLRQ